ncbi:MAG: FAD-dependent oxidoreductase [Oscillospiraceae bacterium]|nr:FAD-dependent oxidoreductase [Oscillospiraceae bacterium]
MSVLKFPHLFEPLIIGNTVFRNRIFASPQGSSYLEVEQLPTPEVTVYYERKAIGGAATTCMGVRSVDPVSGLNFGDNVIPLRNNRGIAWFSYYTNAISRHGAVPSIELQHSGAFSQQSARAGHPIYGPVEGDYDGFHVLPMTEEQIVSTIDAFIEHAKWAKRCGFGMVTVHGGHGWLLGEFLSPLFNTRTDRWGGSIENRARLAREICKGIHEKVPGLVVELRISGGEGLEDGYGVETGIEIAKSLDGYPDIIHVSVGHATIDDAFTVMCPSMFMPDGVNVKYAAAIKPHIKYSKVGTVGALSDPELMEEIISSGKADIVNMARGLIADPDLPLKARTGHEKDINKCLRCSYCFSHLVTTGQYACALNPEIGREREYTTEPLKVTHPKKVLVLGGGIAGMQAALTAAGRGHAVTLAEKSDRLGGILLCEAEVPFKRHLHEYIENQIRRIEEAGIEVLLNTALTPAQAEEMKPDAIIAAIGSDPVVPPIPGVDGENVMQAQYAYTHAEELDGRTVILGGGLVGVELGIFLKNLGKDVAVVEMADKLNCGDNIVHEWGVMAEIRRNGLETHTSTKALKIDEKGVTCQGPDGEAFFPADHVVIAAGMRGRQKEAAAFAQAAPVFYQVGDCLAAANIAEANRLGFNAAMELGTRW